MSDFYRRLDEAERDARNKRIFENRPANLHDYQDCANDEALKLDTQLDALIAAAFPDPGLKCQQTVDLMKPMMREMLAKLEQQERRLANWREHYRRQLDVAAPPESKKQEER